MTEEELRRRVAEVWPDSGLGGNTITGEGITDVSRDGTDAVLYEWYISGAPQYKVCYRYIRKGMKRRPQALAYVCGERNDFND